MDGLLIDDGTVFWSNFPSQHLLLGQATMPGFSLIFKVWGLSAQGLTAWRYIPLILGWSHSELLSSKITYSLNRHPPPSLHEPFVAGKMKLQKLCGHHWT